MLARVLTIFFYLIAFPAFAEDVNLADKFRATSAPIADFQFARGDDTSLNIRDFRGRFVLLNLWTTSCAPCIAEMGALDRIAGMFDEKNLVVIALNEDVNGAARVPNFNRRHKIKNLRVFVDPSGMAPFHLKIKGFPTSILINPQGIEIGRAESSIAWDSPQSLEFLKSKLR